MLDMNLIPLLVLCKMITVMLSLSQQVQDKNKQTNQQQIEAALAQYKQPALNCRM